MSHAGGNHNGRGRPKVKNEIYLSGRSLRRRRNEETLELLHTSLQQTEAEISSTSFSLQDKVDIIMDVSVENYDCESFPEVLDGEDFMDSSYCKDDADVFQLASQQLLSYEALLSPANPTNFEQSFVEQSLPSSSSPQPSDTEQEFGLNNNHIFALESGENVNDEGNRTSGLCSSGLEGEKFHLGALHFDCEVCFLCQCTECEVCEHSEDNTCAHCGPCMLSLESVGQSDGDETTSSDSENEGIFDGEDEVVMSAEEKLSRDMRKDLRDIALSHNVPHSLLSDLLGFMRKYKIGDMPKCPKTLLKTPRAIANIRSVPPGQYWHNGLTKHIKRFLEINSSCPEIEISFSVDGLPLASSSNSQFFPLSCSFNNSPEVYLVGAYHGLEKPADSNDFLRDFVHEVIPLCESGFQFKGRSVAVRVVCAVCDCPAKSFILKTKGHTGYFSCSKCEVEGEYIGRRMTFTDCHSQLRTDAGFASHIQEEYHMGETILLQVPGFGCVSCVPVEYLHLILLGVLKKQMYMLIQGPFSVRLKSDKVMEISVKLEDLSNWVPREFVRKPRSLRFIKRFKATEFRQILFYTGVVIFRKSLPQKLYDHFLVLHVSISMLANPDVVPNRIQYARELLVYFVETFKILYGYQYISHNVHNLVHLPDDVEKFGPLDNFSAFKYENFLQGLLKLVRKGEKPLQQLASRYLEKEYSSFNVRHSTDKSANQYFCGQHVNGPLPDACVNPQYKSCKLASGFQINFSQANNCCGLSDGSIICVENFATSEDGDKDILVVGRKFLTVDDLYHFPCLSSEIGIFEVCRLSENLMTWPAQSIVRKYYRIPLKSSSYAVIPLLHCEQS